MSNPAASVPLRSFAYTQVDVFAARPLEGNMLAIVHDGRGLSDAEMQALARETNLSETTFILPADDPATEAADGVRVRIFTAQEELPFAGHPTLGTASWLYWNHPTLARAETIRLKLNVGPVPVHFQPADPKQPGVFGTMRQGDPVFGNVHDRAEVAAVLGLTPDDLDPTLPVQTVSTGMPFVIVPIVSAEAMARLAIPQNRAQPWLDAARAKFFYCITPAEPASGAHIHARMQFYNGEDPATGSAAGCAIAYLVRHGRAASGVLTTIQQGVEMLRPSLLYTRATMEGQTVSGVFVSGRTILVASGTFFLPARP